MSFIFLLLELALLAILCNNGMTYIPDLLAAVLILTYSEVYIICIQRKHVARKFSAALITGYMLRIALLFFDIYGKNIYGLPNSGADSVGFYKGAVSFSNGGPDWGIFTIVMGYVFRYLGISALFGQFLLTLCSVISLETAAKIFDVIGLDDRKANSAMWILSLLPNFAILSVIFLRESIVTVCITLSFYQFILWYKGKGEKHFLIAIFFSFLGMRFHSGAIALPVSFVFSRMLFDRKTGKFKIKLQNVLSAIFLLIIGVFFLNKYGSNLLSKFSKVEDLNDVANTNTSGGSSYARYVGNSNNPLNMIIYTIPRMVFFLFSPMPWMIRGISDIIAFCFSSCFYLLTTVRVICYFKRNDGANKELVLLITIIVLCATFVFGWGVSNCGTACRHRDKMVIIWGILFGLTIPVKNCRKDIIRDEIP